MVSRRSVLAAAALIPLAAAGRKPRTHVRTINDGVGLMARAYAVRIGVPPAPELSVTSLWVGNTLPGVDHVNGVPTTAPVSQNAFAGWVSADGLVVTNCLWDENGRKGAAYRDGQPAGVVHFGTLGGWAVTGDNAGYLYAATHPDSNNPEIGKYDDHPTESDGATFGVITEVAVHSTGTPRGMAVVGSELFVAVPEANAVDVHQTSTLAWLRTFTVPAPTRMASDGTRLWIATGGQVKAYTTAGVATGAAVTDTDTPTAVAVAPDGTLLVGDDGPTRQQVYVYDITGTPAKTATIGVAAGRFSTPTGAVGELRFDGIVGVGKDTDGVLYVVQDHPGMADVRTSPTPGSTGESVGTGTNIEAYTFTAGAWHRSWQLLGLEFVDCATVDPYTATTSSVDVYSADEHYRIDLATNAWSWVGHTTNRHDRPTDLRLGNEARIPLRILMLGGSKYLINTDMSGAYIAFYLLSGEQATQVAQVNGGRAAVDVNGNIWGVYDDWMYRRAFTGVTGDVPQYGPEVDQNQPALFTKAGRCRYDAAADSMYVLGFTAARPAWSGSDKVAGTVLARYSNWTGGNRTAAWTVDTPSFPGTTLSSGNGLGVVSFDLAGDLLFGTMLTDGSPDHQTRMYAWSAATGAQVATWLPGPTFGKTGWVDVYDGVNATVLPNGDTLVFQEEDFRAKILGYRLR